MRHECLFIPKSRGTFPTGKGKRRKSEGKEEKEERSGPDTKAAKIELSSIESLLILASLDGRFALA